MGGYRFRSPVSRQSVVRSLEISDNGQLTTDSLFLIGIVLIQIQIQLQHVYSCFAQKAELSTLSVRATIAAICSSLMPRSRATRGT